MSSPLTPGTPAPDAELLTPANSPDTLSAHWRERPIALFFERHVGCSFCREHVAYVRGDYEKFKAAGGDVVVITQGPAEAARRFVERLALPFPVLADPTRGAYRAFAVPRATFWQLANPSKWWTGIKSLARHGVGTPQGGDVAQMPGAFVIDRNGTVRLAHYFADVADWPPNEQVIDTLRQCSPDKRGETRAGPRG